jgi:hypothetical protein
MRWTRQCRVRFSGSRGDFIVSDSEAHETSGNVAYGEVVWSWHPLLVSSRAEALVGPTGCATPFNPRGDGDKKELVAGESTKETVKTIAQGRPDDPAPPVVTTLCLLPMHRGHGCGWHPAFPAPSLFPEGTTIASTRGARRLRARSCVRAHWDRPVGNLSRAMRCCGTAGLSLIWLKAGL